MKKIVKIVGSLVLTASMMLSMTGCAITDVKNASDEIMKNTFDFKGKKVTKYFNEDDKNCDDDAELFEEYMNNFSEFIDADYDEIKISKRKINIKNADATVEFVFEVEDEEFEFELNLTKDGDDWVIDDNEEFILSAWALYFDMGLEIGSKASKNKIEDMMDYYDADDSEELAKEFYDFSVDMISMYK